MEWFDQEQGVNEKRLLNRIQDKLIKWTESQFLHFAENLDNLKRFISRFELNHGFVSESKIKIKYNPPPTTYIYMLTLNVCFIIEVLN